MFTMIPAIVSLVLIATGQTHPTDGPALPLGFLARTRVIHVVVKNNWMHGCYGVRFQYRSEKTVKDLAGLLDKEPQMRKGMTPPSAKNYVAYRTVDGIAQSVEIYGPVTSATTNKKEAPFSTIYVDEELATESAPSAWYKGALSAKPPLALIEVPFLPGVRADRVNLTSFDGLMSSNAMIFRGKDAAVFGAVTNREPAEVAKSLASWAKANGYRSTPFGSYFKAGSKTFEIMVNPYPMGKSKGTYITLVTSDRQAEHPIARIKD